MQVQTSYPCTQLSNHRPGKPDTLSQHTKCRQAIPVCSHPIPSQGSQTCYPSMYSVDMLPQHAVTQSQARKARHAIPACSHITRCPITGQGSQTSYPSMHSANKLSQHALQNIQFIFCNACWDSLPTPYIV